MTEKRALTPRDAWTRGDAYERYVGRWSRVVAREFLDWLAVAADGHWLDVGCGTGALSEAILQRANPALLMGIDRSTEYVHHAGATIRGAQAHFCAGEAQALPLAASTFDASVSGFVLNFIPQPERALSEMVRVVQPGGIVAVYVWDYAGRTQFMRHFWNAASALDPAAVDLDEGRRFPICQPERLTSLLEGAGLAHVEARAIDIATDFVDFDDYWSPFLSGQGPAPSYAASLDDVSRTALRERIRAGLPWAADGSIPMTARAWAVRGWREAT